MFSPSKILWLALILISVWFFFKILDKWKKKINSERKSDNHKDQTIDLRECKKCGQFINVDENHKC